MDLVEATHVFSGEGARHSWERARLDVARKLIARHVALSPGSIVIDIGCGDAFVTASLAAAFPEARIAFINAQPELVALSKATGRAVYNGPRTGLAGHLEPEGDRLIGSIVARWLAGALGSRDQRPSR